jgi:hypothetical protein
LHNELVSIVNLYWLKDRCIRIAIGENKMQLSLKHTDLNKALAHFVKLRLDFFPIPPQFFYCRSARIS